MAVTEQPSERGISTDQLVERYLDTHPRWLALTLAERERRATENTEVIVHARWHSALDNPSSETPGPIRDHIEQHDRKVAAGAWSEGYGSGVSDEATSQDWTDGQVPPARVNPYGETPEVQL